MADANYVKVRRISEQYTTNSQLDKLKAIFFATNFCRARQREKCKLNK